MGAQEEAERKERKKNTVPYYNCLTVIERLCLFTKKSVKSGHNHMTFKNQGGTLAVACNLHT